MSEQKHIAFRVSGDSIAVAIRNVLSIVPYTKPARLPGTPPHVRGVVQHRGKMMPVVDLAEMYGGEPVRPGPFTVVVVLEHAGTLTGVLADEVTGIVDLAGAAKIGTGSERLAPILWNEGVALVLDVPRAFDSESMSRGPKGEERA